jgi:hypothetical protein
MCADYMHLCFHLMLMLHVIVQLDGQLAPDDDHESMHIWLSARCATKLKGNRRARAQVAEVHELVSTRITRMAQHYDPESSKHFTATKFLEVLKEKVGSRSDCRTVIAEENVGYRSDCRRVNVGCSSDCSNSMALRRLWASHVRI